MSKRPGAHARVWRVDRVNPAIDTGDLEVLRDRHLAHYAALAQRAGPLLEVGGIVAGLEWAREAGDVHCANWAGQFLGAAHQQLGDMATARRVLDDTVAATQEEGDLYNLSGALYWRGRCHLATGRLADAESDFWGGCELASMLQDFTGRLFWVMVGLTAGLRGRHDEARAVIDDAVSEARETKNDFTLACGLTARAFLERATGDVDATAAAAEEATDLWRAWAFEGGWLRMHWPSLAGPPCDEGISSGATALDEGLTASAGPPAASWVLVTQALVARRRATRSTPKIVPVAVWPRSARRASSSPTRWKRWGEPWSTCATTRMPPVSSGRQPRCERARAMSRGGRRA